MNKRQRCADKLSAKGNSNFKGVFDCTYANIFIFLALPEGLVV